MLKKFVAALMSAVMLSTAFSFNVLAEDSTSLKAFAEDETASGSSIKTGPTTDLKDATRKLVVIMDTSGSMGRYGRDDGAVDYAKKYAEKVLSKNKAAVAVVSFGQYSSTGGARVELDFTTDYSKFENCVDNLYFSDDEDMGKAFELTKDLIQKSGSVKTTEILLITDAFPMVGSEKSPSKFAEFSGLISTDVIEHAEYVYDFVKNELPSNWYIKTKGIYYGLSEDSDDYKFAKAFMEALANPPGNSEMDIEYNDDDFDVDYDDSIREDETETTTTVTHGKSSPAAVVKHDKEMENTNSRKIEETEDVYYYGALKDFPLIETYDITNKEGAVSAVENMINLINEDKTVSVEDEDVNFELVNFANEAIALASSQELPSDGILTAEIVENAAKDAKDAKKAVDNLLDSKNVDLINSTLTSANIVSSSNTVQIDENVDALSIDNLNIIVGDGAGRIILGKDFISENANADEPIIISLEVEGVETTAENATITTDEETDVTEEVAASNAPSAVFTTNLKTFSRPVVLSLNLISNASPTYQGVTGPDGYAVSKPNNSTRKIDFRATANGTYTVKNVTSLDFTDINTLSSAQQDTLRKLYAHGLIEGKSKTSFAPTTTLTRAEFTTLLVKTMGEYDPNYKGTSGFVDMKNQWSAPIIAKAKDLGIIAGYDSDNTFRPDNKLNNEQLYHLLGLAFTKSNKKASANTSAQISKLSDGSSIAPWAQKNVAVSLQYNIYVPREDGAFASRNEVTRYSAAVAMGNLFDKAQFTASWK